MNRDLIVLPLIAMCLLTFVIGFRMGKLRFKAVKEDGLKFVYFKTNRGADIPDYLAKVTNHYVNLFEMPVLFYLVSLVIYAGNKVDMVYLFLAWLFVGLRYIHAYIHTTYNHLRHRMAAFSFGCIVLALIWIRLAVQIISAN